MSTILNSLLRVDLSRVSAEILEGLQSGRMILSASNGNVYWASRSGSSGIVTQLPLVPVSPQELASAEQLLKVGQALKAAQAATMVTTTVAAAVVVVVVVAAAVYLTGRIERVHSAVLEVSELVAQQDLREYLHYVTDYVSAVGASQELLSARLSQTDLSKLAVPRIDRLAELRQQTLNFVRGLPQILSRPNTTQAQYEHAFRFMIEMLDWVPAALAIERELCLVAGLPSLAQSRREHAAAQFRSELARFHDWCEMEFRKVALGDGGHIDVLLAQRDSLSRLFNSPVHGILLDGLMADAAPRGTVAQQATPELVMQHFSA